MFAIFGPFDEHDGLCLVPILIIFLIIWLMIGEPKLIHFVRLRNAIEIDMQERTLRRVVWLHQGEAGAGHHHIAISERLNKRARQRGFAHAKLA